VSVEQTTTTVGEGVAAGDDPRRPDVARRHELRTHLDGARLMNAVVASGVDAGDYAKGFDTAWLDFTKGLGAPVGAVLAGSQELIAEAWRFKQMLGGAFRQSGIVAAGACTHSTITSSGSARTTSTPGCWPTGSRRYQGDPRSGRGGDEHRDLRDRRRSRPRAPGRRRSGAPSSRPAARARGDSSGRQRGRYGTGGGGDQNGADR